MSGFAGRRRTVTVAESTLTRRDTVAPGQDTPLVVEAAVPGVNLITWAERHQDELGRALVAHGAILFRGFALDAVEQLERFIAAVSGEAMDYTYRSTPRTRVSGRIYTSTEYPPDQQIPLHSEMAYARTWPNKVFFFCVRAAQDGGETPMADNRRVFELIDPAIREKFARTGVRYARNYGDELDLPWPEVFQTDDRHAVERYCADHGIAVEWRAGDRLRTSQTAQAVVAHPVTGANVWFNQAHLFHVSGLPPQLRDALLRVVEPDELPRNAYYGDGSPIDDAVLNAVRAAYERAQVVFPWTTHDLLLVDNVRVAHGRRPFVGTRQIVVGMSEPGGDRSLGHPR